MTRRFWTSVLLGTLLISGVSGCVKVLTTVVVKSPAGVDVCMDDGIGRIEQIYGCSRELCKDPQANNCNVADCQARFPELF